MKKSSITFRVTPRELSNLSYLASKAGMTIPEYVRATLMSVVGHRAAIERRRELKGLGR